MSAWRTYLENIAFLLKLEVVNGPVANDPSAGDNKRAITRRWC